MKWLLILAIWNTDPPQDSFKFYTQRHPSQESCEKAIEAVYKAASEHGASAQAFCASEAQLDLLQSYS